MHKGKGKRLYGRQHSNCFLSQVLSSIYHYIKGPNPLHPAVLKDRLFPMKMRQFVQDDLPQCLELYRLNAPGRFPEGVMPDYEESLKNGSSYHLVVEHDGQIVASGGMSYFIRQDVAVLCFGLVHPGYQGKGVGTALLLARLSLLKQTFSSYHVFIFAVEKSIGFYRRFGFSAFQDWKDSQGKEHPSGHLEISAREIRRCRSLLEKHQIILPDDEGLVPFRKKDEP